MSERIYISGEAALPLLVDTVLPAGYSLSLQSGTDCSAGRGSVAICTVSYDTYEAASVALCTD